MQNQDALAERSASQTALSATSAMLLDLALSAKESAASSKADSTRRAYTSDLKTFATWCALVRLASFPADPQTIALYIEHLKKNGRKMATIERAMVSIAQAHREAGESSPCAHDVVRAVRKGIAKTIGTAPKKKTAMPIDALRAMVKACPDTLRGKRDRAVLLVGFAGAFRRSELASLDVSDVAFVSEGAEVTLRRSKTDQTGKGCLLYTSPSPRDRTRSRMPSSA